MDKNISQIEMFLLVYSYLISTIITPTNPVYLYFMVTMTKIMSSHQRF